MGGHLLQVESWHKTIPTAWVFRYRILHNIFRGLGIPVTGWQVISDGSTVGNVTGSSQIDSYISLVYRWCMSRTNIDIDDKACAAVMRRYQFSTKREAVNFALQTLATEPFTLDEARKLRGSGWIGDLEEMRTNRSA